MLAAPIGFPLAVALLMALPSASVAQSPAVPLVVSAAWLRDHASDPKLVVLYVGPKRQYDSVHVAGARFANLEALDAPRGAGLSLELPSVERADSAIERLGISNDSKVVLYTTDWVTPAARVLLTLEWAGLGGRVGMLDGGFAAWQRAGGATGAEVPQFAAGSFTVKPHPELFADAATIRSALGTRRIAVIDARDAGFYLDTLDSHMPRGGHIPGAHSVPYTSLTDEQDMLKPAAELQRIFREAGAEKGKPVVVYCHIGQQGSWVRLVARTLGYDARLYDGSFQEWSANAAWPVEGLKRATGGVGR